MPTHNLTNLRAIIKRGLLAEADPDYLESIQALVPSSAPIMGIRVPKIRDWVKRFAQDHRELTMQDAMALLDMAFQDQVREEILFNIFLMVRFKRQFTPKLWPKIDLWIESIENWEVCDQMAANMAGEILAKNLDLLEDLLLWVKSPNLWRRRFALATACVLNQKGRNYPDQTLRVCAEVMTDDEVMVQKALSWALREASKKAPQNVYAFLLTWKGKVSRSLMKQASQKLEKAQVKALLA